ncbi:MAG: hypothetical protein J6B23_07505 [Clostridia bacterium]|nr:hypothetical protein [Clostridia bacterium]
MENKIENYLGLAQMALDGNNYSECENYVNKILEIDSLNTDAYLLKINALLVKQRYGYNEDEKKIDEERFIANVEKQKSSCYSILINKCTFSKKHIQRVMDFVMDEFFDESSERIIFILDIFKDEYQELNDKETSIDLLVHVLRNVSNSSDDEIIKAFLGIYEKAKQDGKELAKIFLKSCLINQEFEFEEKEIEEKFYRELIKIIIYDILSESPEINYTIKELIEDNNCINSIGLSEHALKNVKKEINIINNLIGNVKICNPHYDIYDDEISEEVKLLNRWISWNYYNYKKYTLLTYNRIKRINPNYVFDESVQNTIKSYTTENKQGCYIATCVYGSYDCPQVWVLRRYRDNHLSKTLYGRCFVKLYYFISPKLVKTLGNTNWFKHIGKKKLDKLVKKLNNIGYANTRYYD